MIVSKDFKIMSVSSIVRLSFRFMITKVNLKEEGTEEDTGAHDNNVGHG